MPIRTPKFWYSDSQKNNQLLPIILSPLSALYQIGHCINQKSQTTRKAEIPVICIGNITAGGSGKTPTAISIANIMSLELSTFFLTKGYGASNDATRIIESHEAVQEAGDEPKILANHCKTIISKNRYTGAKLAQDHGAELIIMDDGFQNQTLHKDLNLIVIDGAMGLGNKKTLPSGPLREPLSKALDRSDAIILIGEDTHNVKGNIPHVMPIFLADIITKTTFDLSKQYIGFAGIGFPEKFKKTLINQDINLVDFIEYPDHHPYSVAELKSLLSVAANKNAILITTEKDYIKIPAEYQELIQVLPIKLEFKDMKKMSSFLKDRLNSIMSS